jgi:spore coat polysaccharide biosynthesis protein SpsF
MNFKKIINKKNFKIFVICRLNSKRLKKKITKKILNLSILEILVLRLSKKFGTNNIIICTGSKKHKFFSNIKKKYKIKIFYGDDKNIFKRLLDASKKFNVKCFARVTGDNPLTDVDILHKMLLIFFKKKLDYIYTNGLFPGLRSEIISVKSLLKCYNLSEDPNSSEYLTYYFLRKNLFKIFCYKKKRSAKEKRVSITIDRKKDFFQLSNIIKNKKDFFVNSIEILKRLKASRINKEKKLIPLKNLLYNVRLKTDDKKMKYLNLKNFFL